tara:strand:- start:3180 stop:3872 length:693 start_codon:yes stop_codon:yes gene_type:complete
MQLTIPIYQRTYSWKIKECEQLWKDILKAGNNEDISGHFVGSIVYVEKGIYQVSSLPRLLVIDGQQRLTTLSLLISALCSHIKKKNTKTEINPEKLLSYYLLNSQEDGEEKYKLVLTQADKTSYFKILENLNFSEEDSIRIKENYEFFKEQIEKVAQDLLKKLNPKLVIGWRKKQQAKAAVRVEIEKQLDDGLPNAYTRKLFLIKCQMIFQHFYDNYYGDGKSVYTLVQH